jgi:hypothetical protein
MLKEKIEIVLRRKLKPASIWTGPLLKKKQDKKLFVFGKLTSDKNLKLSLLLGTQKLTLATNARMNFQ